MWSSNVGGQRLISCCQAQFEHFYCKWRAENCSCLRGISVAFWRLFSIPPSLSLPNFVISSLTKLAWWLPRRAGFIAGLRGSASNGVVVIHLGPGWSQWRPRDIPDTQPLLRYAKQLVNSSYYMPQICLSMTTVNPRLSTSTYSLA